MSRILDWETIRNQCIPLGRGTHAVSPALRLGDLEFEASLDNIERKRRKGRREREHSVDMDSYFINDNIMLKKNDRNQR